MIPPYSTHSTGPKGVLSDYYHSTRNNNFEEITILNELKSQVQQINKGHVKEIDLMNYVSIIDNACPDTFVIIHIDDKDNMYSQQTLEHLKVIATKNVKQVKIYNIQLQQIESVMNFDPIALPALLVYRDKDLISTLLRINDDIPEWTRLNNCSTLAFEQYLYEHEIEIENDEATQYSSFYSTQ